eukprot:15436196-Alexandrium_andersonii.AAC.1
MLKVSVGASKRTVPECSRCVGDQASRYRSAPATEGAVANQARALQSNDARVLVANAWVCVECKCLQRHPKPTAYTRPRPKQ